MSLEVLYKCMEKGIRVQVDDWVFVKVSHMKGGGEKSLHGKEAQSYICKTLQDL